MLGMGGGGEGQRLTCLPHCDLLNLSKMPITVLSVVQSNTKRKVLQTWTCKSKEVEGLNTCRKQKRVEIGCGVMNTAVSSIYADNALNW